MWRRQATARSAVEADVTAGFQFYAPTGTYDPRGAGNTGRGMWTYEPYVGTIGLFR